ncbi:site-specific integrase [Pseudomonas sp. CCNWLW23]|uniref:site-specific integrase n=1 Tax=Pseudomonas sp. CCNWLW23 TaxID=3126385 RepID=UPI003012DEDB
MNNETSTLSMPILFDLDLQRTERARQVNGIYYWEEDDLIRIGQRRLRWSRALSQLSPSLKASFKQNLISFSSQGDYSPNSFTSLCESIMGALKAFPTSTFDTNWVSQALRCSSFHRYKSGIKRFFLHWQELDSTAISPESLRLLHDASAIRTGPRNVLSDDPEKSWLTNEEYEGLLSAVWSNYDNGVSSTQVTLIKLLSMQYARRPRQIALLKIGDIRECEDLVGQGLKGRFIAFPGIKDITAENDFRDSKFELHQVPDHLWNLCCLQRHEAKDLYEQTLSHSLCDLQLSKLPLFCSEARIKEARQIIENQYHLNIFENLDSELFHLKKIVMIDILTWKNNTPNCNYGLKPHKRSLRPKPPITVRTGQIMVVTATRMRHTRARQLARKGVPKHMLSHWLGHISEKSVEAYYNDPAEQARQLDEAMAPALAPLAMAFTGALIDSERQSTKASDPTSRLEFARAGTLKNVGICGKHSFCTTTSVPIPCYRCKHFEPLVDAPHHEVLEALLERQTAEEQMVKIGGPRNLLAPIDLSSDIRAVENCIERCNARRTEREMDQ